MTLKPALKKIIKILVIVLAALALFCLILFLIGKPQKNITWGITFSTIRAQELGFDSQSLFTTILNDIHPAKIRLPLYWSEIEPQQGQFNFAVYETETNEVEIISETAV